MHGAPNHGSCVCINLQLGCRGRDSYSGLQKAEIAILGVLHSLYTVVVVLFGMKGVSGDWSTICRSVLVETTLFEFVHVIVAVWNGNAAVNQENLIPALPSWGCRRSCSSCCCDGMLWSWSPEKKWYYRNALVYIQEQTRTGATGMWIRALEQWRHTSQQHVEIDDKFVATWAVQCWVRRSSSCFLEPTLRRFKFKLFRVRLLVKTSS